MNPHCAESTTTPLLGAYPPYAPSWSGCERPKHASDLARRMNLGEQRDPHVIPLYSRV